MKPPIRYIWLPLILILFATSLTGNWFYYASSAGFYAYTITIGLLAVFAALLLSFPGNRIALPLSLPLGIFFIYTSYILLNSIAKGGFNYISLWALANFIFALSTTLLLFSAPNQPFPTPNAQTIDRLLTGLSLLAAIESLVCIAQFGKLLPSYDPHFPVTGTMENPNIAAMFLALCLPAILTFILQQNKSLRKLSIGIFVLVLIALALLNCRSAIIGSAVATFLFLLFQFDALAKRRRLTTLLITAVLLLLCFPLSRYLYQLKRPSADGRQFIWRLSARIAAENPATGIGYGHFQQQFNLRQAEFIRSGNATSQEQHNARTVYVAYNEYLQNAVEGGIPGVVLYIALLTALLLAPLRSVKTGRNSPGLITAWSAMAGFAVMSAVNFTAQAIPLTGLFSVYAAILMSYSPARPIASRVLPGYALVLFLVITGAYIDITQVRTAIADNKNRQARQWLADHQPELALSILPSLAGPLAGYESYWKNYGYALVADKKYAAALPILQKAKTLVTEPGLFMATGYCYAQLKNDQAAIPQYQEAIYLEPSRPESRAALSSLLETTIVSLTTETKK